MTADPHHSDIAPVKSAAELCRKADRAHTVYNVKIKASIQRQIPSSFAKKEVVIALALICAGAVLIEFNIATGLLI